MMVWIQSPRWDTPVLPTAAEPFAADRGPAGVVVCHGFTGTPASMRPWAEHLAAAGYTVRLPLLPGHGTCWQDTNRTRWQDWFCTIERAYTEIAARCEQVFTVGLSMGATLALRLAQRHPASIRGLVLVNPSLATERFAARFARYLAWAVRSRAGIGNDIHKPAVTEQGYGRTPVAAFASLQQLWRVVLADLDTVRAPILLYRSREDHVVEPLSARLLQAGATSTTVREIILEHSYHVATLDYDAPQIFEGSVQFLRSLTPEGACGDGGIAERVLP